MTEESQSDATGNTNSQSDADAEVSGQEDGAQANDATDSQGGTEATESTKDEPEQKAEPEQKDDAAKDDADADAESKDGEEADKAETTYEAFDIPEGMELNEAVLKKAAPLFKELGLDQAAAQKLVNFYSAEIKAEGDARIDKWAEMQAANQKAIEEHPELGGKNLDANLGLASRAIDNLVENPEGLRAALDTTGAGNDPFIFEALVNVGKMMKEDSFVRGKGGGTPKKQDAAEVLYPNEGSGD